MTRNRTPHLSAPRRRRASSHGPVRYRDRGRALRGLPDQAARRWHAHLSPRRGRPPGGALRPGNRLPLAAARSATTAPSSWPSSRTASWNRSTRSWRKSPPPTGCSAAGCYRRGVARDLIAALPAGEGYGIDTSPVGLQPRHRTTLQDIGPSCTRPQHSTSAGYRNSFRRPSAGPSCCHNQRPRQATS